MLSCDGGILRVLVADDHELTRFTLKLALQRQADIELVGSAKNGQEAIEMTQQCSPDVVILDIQMPVLDGLTASCQIKQIHPSVQILIFSSLENPQTAIRLQTAPIDAFCQKEVTMPDLVRIIRNLGARAVGKQTSDLRDVKAFSWVYP
jgi:two-component system, NarL family, vancomycin resistance associated response regulator VraR